MQSKFDLANWGGYAVCYDALNELRPYQNLQNTLLANLEMGKKQIILDAACGTGNLAWHAVHQQKIGATKIIGMDFSQEMLILAKNKCPNPQIKLLRSDLNKELFFPDNFFDKISSCQTIYALKNPLQTLKEFFRILKIGGKLIIATPIKGFENGLILKEHCNDIGPEEPWLDAHKNAEKELALIEKAISDPTTRIKFQAIANHNRRIQQNVNFHFFSPEELIDLLQTAGFKILKHELVYARQTNFVIAMKGGQQ